MSKLRVFRLGNSLLLGLICFLTASVFFLSNGAQAQDPYGTDCAGSWGYAYGGCQQGGGTLTSHDTGGYDCSTSPTGLCCTYRVEKIVCSNDPTLTGYYYGLWKAGAAGICPKSSSAPSQCIYYEPVGGGGTDV